MLKKAISLLSALAVLTLSSSNLVFAENINADLIKSPIELSVSNNGSVQSFDPSLNQVLSAKVTFLSTKANATGTVVVKKGSTVVKTLHTIAGIDAAVPLNLTWNAKDIDNTPAAQGICGAAGAACPAGAYTVVADVVSAFGADNLIDSETATFTIGTNVPIVINSFTVTPTPVKAGGNFDPALNGDNQDLVVNFALSQSVDSVQLEIKDFNDKVVKADSASNIATGSFSWNGEFSGKIVPPGTYKVTLKANKIGQPQATSTKDQVISYSNANKGGIENFTIVPTTFDPDFEDAVIEFKNTKDAELTVQIKDVNNEVIKTFDLYTDDNYSANASHSISWNGTNVSGGSVPLATYKVVVVSRNEFGAAIAEKTVTVNDTGGSASTSNAHIDSISFSPASNFEPSTDEELEIEFDVQQDLDELKIYAVRGSDKIELYAEEDIEKEDNLQVTWDGTDDDDEYVADGSWKIQFESTKGASKLIAVKAINVDYEKPEIRDLYLSKDKFDNDEGEFTNILFRVDADASVTIKVLNDGDEDDDVVEDLEVEADQWYAVQWDGGSYEYDDNLDLKLIAENIANENIFDSEKVDVDLQEEKVASSKANITQDYIDPAVTSGSDEMTVYYTLDEEADVTVTIHNGKTTTGTTKIELLDVSDQGSGEHSVTWDGRDEDGKKFSAGFYTYKIVAKTSSSEIESGVFVVGDVGDDGGGSSNNNDDDDDDDGGGGVGPGVIVDGGSGEPDDDGGYEPPVYEDEDCGGFSDVSSTHENCQAIAWAQATGVFVGYGNGKFGPEQPINRVEFLKVILLALGIKEDMSVTGNLGFKDVETGAWYMPFVSKAKALGIFVGDQGKATARPADSVNRAEALKMLFVSVQSAGGDASLSSCANLYLDVPNEAWFQPYVACFNYSYGLMEPVDSQHFIPNKPATRAEVAEMLYRLYQLNIL